MSAGLCPVCEQSVGHVESQSMGHLPASVYRLMPCGHEVDKETASQVLAVISGA